MLIILKVRSMVPIEKCGTQLQGFLNLALVRIKKTELEAPITIFKCEDSYAN
jgi:hypothetical protein